MISIDPEFQSLIPPLSSDERAQLEANIVADGCRDPLVVWGCDGLLVDGHNRYEICTRRGIEFDVVEMEFGSRDEVKLWICRNQLGRRNLTDFQRVELALAMKPIVEARAKANHLANAGDKVSEAASQNSGAPIDKIRTDETLADMAGVSRDTVRKVEKIIEQAAPELVAQVRAGDVSINAASQVATLPKDVQVDIASTGPEEVKEVAKTLRNGPHVANNSGNNEWYTPSEYIDAARSVMGSIDTDPASSTIANERVQAAQFFTAADNGLAQTWHGNVWMNPPYAQPLIAEFSNALVEKYRSGEIDQACVLVNNATDTTWFRLLAENSSATCFTKGRVRFIDPDGKPSGAPLQGQAVLYFGDNAEAFADAFKAVGYVFVGAPVRLAA